MKKSSNLDAIQIIKVQGGTLEESFLDEGEQACVGKDVSKLFSHLSILRWAHFCTSLIISLL